MFTLLPHGGATSANKQILAAFCSAWSRIMQISNDTGSSGTHSLQKTHMPRKLVGGTSGGIRPNLKGGYLWRGEMGSMYATCARYALLISLFLYSITKDVERETISNEKRNSLDS